MKRLMIIAICALISTSAMAQKLNNKDSKAIDGKVTTFLSLMESKSYTKVLDLIYPEFFKHSPKKDLFQMFQLLEMSGIELKFNDLKILDKSSLGSENDIDYSLIKYSLNMELPLTTDDLKGIAAFIVPRLESNFGKENVEYNKEKSYIKVQGEKYLVGVKDPEYKDWLFLIYDKSFRSELEKTLPAKVNAAASASAF